MKYRIFTNSSEYYDVTEKGYISRPKLSMSPSGQWKAVALARFDNFGRMVQHEPFELWEEFLSTNPEWTYKNGKPRFRLLDWDHGTSRILGHGILKVKLLQETAV